MKVDHQQNHQKYLKEDSQLKFIFVIIMALIIKVNQIRILIFDFFENKLVKTKKLNNKYKQAK